MHGSLSFCAFFSLFALVVCFLCQAAHMAPHFWYSRCNGPQNMALHVVLGPPSLHLRHNLHTASPCEAPWQGDAHSIMPPCLRPRRYLTADSPRRGVHIIYQRRLHCPSFPDLPLCPLLLLLLLAFFARLLAWKVTVAAYHSTILIDKCNTKQAIWHLLKPIPHLLKHTHLRQPIAHLLQPTAHFRLPIAHLLSQCICCSQQHTATANRASASANCASSAAYRTSAAANQTTVSTSRLLPPCLVSKYRGLSLLGLSFASSTILSLVLLLLPPQKIP